MLHSILYSFSNILAGVTMLDRFELLRKSFLQTGTGNSSAVAIILAGLLLIISMLRIAYNLMSDEQNGGFGGLRMWEVLRPIVICVIIMNFSTFLEVFDGTVSYVAKNVYYLHKNDELHAEGDELMQESLERINQKEYEIEKSLRILEDITPDSQRDSIVSKFEAYRTGAGSKVNGHTKASAYKLADKLAEAYQTSTDKAEGHKKGFSGIFIWACHTIYHLLFLLIQGMAEIILCVMAVLGPFVFALSIPQSWKDLPLKWIGSYIEVSLWKVVACIIDFVVTHIQSGIFISKKNDIKILMDRMTNDVFSTDISYAMQNQNLAEITDAFNNLSQLTKIQTSACIIALCGIFALFSVPAITSGIVNLAGGGLSGVGGGVISKAGKTAGGVVTAPGKLGTKVMGDSISSKIVKK